MSKYYFSKLYKKDKFFTYLIKDLRNSNKKGIVLANWKILTNLNQDWYTVGGFREDTLRKLEDWEIIKYKLLGLINDS